MRTLVAPMLASLLLTSAASGQSLKAGQIFSSLSVTPISEPHPVLGADNRVHLAYELVIANPGQFYVTVDKVEAVNDSGASLESLSGDELTTMTHRFSGTGNRLAPGETAIVFMDVTFAATERLPASLSARVSLTREAAIDGKPAPYPAGSPIPEKTVFTTSPLMVASGGARVIEAPLRGSGWVSVNGCCDAVTSHRGAVIGINGKLNVPERFAIDWIRLDEQNRMYTGDKNKLTSFAYYGVPIYSVADGVVVNSYDQSDEQVPLEPAKGLSPASIGGNMLVVDIGGGAYAFYAHLQRGSLKAKLGDRVKAGQVLGVLGNTGNTDAPHLHFHLMDGPVPLYAGGLPFVLKRFSSVGVLTDSGIDALFDGRSASPDKRLSGAHHGQMPLNAQVISFEDGRP